MAAEYLTARQAARYVGYTVGDGPVREERQLRSFYEMVRRHRITKHRFGRRRLLFLKTDLDAAVGRNDDPMAERLAHMAQLARDHASGKSGVQ